MYKERGIVSKSETGPVDRKRINAALDKHLERSSPWTLSALKDKDHVSLPSTSSSKHPDQRNGLMPKSKCSDGEIS